MHRLTCFVKSLLLSMMIGVLNFCLIINGCLAFRALVMENLGFLAGLMMSLGRIRRCWIRGGSRVLCLLRPILLCCFCSFYGKIMRHCSLSLNLLILSLSVYQFFSSTAHVLSNYQALN